MVVTQFVIQNLSKAIGFGWVRKNLSQAAVMGLTTYYLPSERIVTGSLLPEGRI